MDNATRSLLEQIFESGHTVLMHRHSGGGDYYVAASGIEGGKQSVSVRAPKLETALSELALKCKARGKQK